MKTNTAILILLLPVLLFSIKIDIEEPIIQNNKFENELPTFLEAGNPKIPYIPIKILLPMGEKLKSVEIEYDRQNELLENVFIEPAKQVQPISRAFSIIEKEIDLSIYNNDEYYPVEDYKVLGTQRLNGYEILLINLYPYKFNPVSKTVSWSRSASLNISSEFDSDLYEEQNKFLISNRKVRDKISAIVENPEIINSYQKHSIRFERDIPDPADPYSMIIITDEEREPYLSEFTEWKNARNIKTRVFLTSDIYSLFMGNDDAEKIKNFIIYAYQAYSGTDFPLEYVLLGGDDEIIPIRGVLIDTGYGTVDYHLPCDLYYSCLDNDWDANGNSVFGEIDDNVDLIPELAIGRIPAETESEFNNFFNKTHHYAENTNFSDDVVYLVGENLNWNPLTWGGDYKDEVSTSVPTLENDYHVYRLYDREGTYNALSIRDAINSGMSIINHMGHSNESIVFGQNSGLVNSYTNTDYGFAYSQGCYPAAFDEATSQQGESIAENLVIREFGLFAFVGNTRYGWYSPGDTNGPSQPYDIAFFEAIFNDNIRQIGKALAESQIVLANQALENAFLRWVHYELVLFGDPSVAVKEANGSFPFLHPLSAIFDDTQGDNDGNINPGEIIEINIPIENQTGWSDAFDVVATISIEDESIGMIQDQVFYGSIQAGESVSSDPFIIEIPQDCNYDSYNFSVQITSSANDEIVFNRSYDLSFEISLFQLNWPWQSFNTISSNPIITDFNNDQEKEILIVDMAANINLLDINAQQVAGFPLWTGESIWKSIAYGDIDNDEQEDVVIASRNGKIMALDNAGDLIFEYDECCEQLLTPMISDIDGDGSDDIISLGTDKCLIALNSDGEMLDNYPVELTHLANSEMASADIDQDGANEILIGTFDGTLQCINKFGENTAGFPVQLSSIITAAPIVLDNLNIAFGTSDHKLYLIDPNGNIEFMKETDQRIANSPIAADFDNDGILEIAFSTINGDLYIVEQDGTDLAGFPVSINKPVANPPLAVDLNNDDNLNLICLTTSNDLYVYNSDGSEIEFSPVTVGLNGNTPAGIEDVDDDGDFEIVCAASNRVIIIDCKLDKGEKIPWNTYRGNFRRTGFYGDNDLFTQYEENEIPNPISRLHQNFPNPFHSSTSIKFTIGNTGKNTEISIYNLKGQKIRSFSNLQSDRSSDQQISWNGKDRNGDPVGSGIYFYKLVNDNRTLDTRKMVLIR